MGAARFESSRVIVRETEITNPLATPISDGPLKWNPTETMLTWERTRQR
jgi:hypothetical protein